MKKSIFFFAATLIFRIHGAEDSYQDPKKWHVNFDTSMGKGSAGYQRKFQKPYNKQKLASLRRLYDRNNLSKVICQDEPKIPRKIHQVWVGPLERPKAFDKLIETWLKHNPGWEYKLWTNEEVKKLKLYNQNFYDQADIPAEKANILRYEILYKFGGLYCDIDFECLRSFEPLIHCYDFFTGLEPVDSSFLISNALIACSPHHPIMRHCIATIKYHMHEKSRLDRNGVGHFTRSFLATAHKVPGTTLAFPTSYFFPLPIKYDTRRHTIRCLEPESFAVHYWAGEHGARRPKVAPRIVRRTNDRNTINNRRAEA